MKTIYVVAYVGAIGNFGGIHKAFEDHQDAEAYRNKKNKELNRDDKPFVIFLVDFEEKKYKIT